MENRLLRFLLQGTLRKLALNSNTLQDIRKEARRDYMRWQVEARGKDNLRTHTRVTFLHIAKSCVTKLPVSIHRANLLYPHGQKAEKKSRT